MTFAELYAAVQDTVDDTSASALTRIKRYINWGQQDIAQRANWPFLKKQATITTAASDEEYSLASDCHKVMELRDTTNDHFIEPVSYETLIQNYPDPINETTGTPTMWYPSTLDTSGYQQIKLFPVPDGAYTVTYDYYKNVSDLSGDSDVSVIPTRYHQLLVDYACWHFYEKEQDPQANYFAVKYENGIGKMMGDAGLESDEMPAIKPQGRSKTLIMGKIGRIYN